MQHWFLWKSDGFPIPYSTCIVHTVVCSWARWGLWTMGNVCSKITWPAALFCVVRPQNITCQGQGVCLRVNLVTLLSLCNRSEGVEALWPNKKSSSDISSSGFNEWILVIGAHSGAQIKFRGQWLSRAGAQWKHLSALSTVGGISTGLG